MKKKIREIIIDVLNIASDEFSTSAVLSDFESWDSLTHMELIVTIEKAFNFEMSFDEIASIKSINDIFIILEKKKI